MAKIFSKREKPKAYSISSQKITSKANAAPKAIEMPPPKKENPEQKSVESPKNGSNDFDQLKGTISKYFSMLPFIRKKELAGIIIDPDNAIQNEIKTTSVITGYKDYVVPTLFIAIPLIILYSLFISVFSLGSGLPMAAIICVGGIVAVPVIILISKFLGTLALFIFSKLLGGKGSFGKMMGIYGSIAGAIVLINLPFTLLSFIPCIGYLFQFVGMAISVYQLYLIYKLNVHLHGLSTKNAILAIALPCIALVLLLVGLILALFGSAFLSILAAARPN